MASYSKIFASLVSFLLYSIKFSVRFVRHSFLPNADATNFNESIKYDVNMQA